MEREEYEIMFRVETSHWWYSGMEAVTRAILDRSYRNVNSLRILDAGCGTGAAMTTYLSDYGIVTGIDLSRIAVDFARQRKTGRLAQASVVELPFAANSFDLVTSFDVLYEKGVPSDLSALKEFLRVLRRGGRLLLRVPAFNWLRGRHDLAVHTARRYTAVQLKDLVHQSGLVVERISYANMLLFPIAMTKRMTERFFSTNRQRSDLTLEPGPLNGMLQTLLEWEAPFVARTGLPFGLSVIAVGRKPDRQGGTS